MAYVSGNLGGGLEDDLVFEASGTLNASCMSWGSDSMGSIDADGTILSITLPNEYTRLSTNQCYGGASASFTNHKLTISFRGGISVSGGSDGHTESNHSTWGYRVVVSK